MKKNYDVIVVGAGPSGINAALCAARKGMQVLLIDKNAYPGGTNTSSMVGPLMTFHAGEKQVIKGIAQEIIGRLAERGGTLGHIPDPIGMVSTITPIDTELLKLVYFDMLSRESGITLLLHTVLTEAQVEDGKIKSICTLGKGGKDVFRGRILIDATGDADLSALCGADFMLGRKHDGLAQPMTLMFSMSGVDLEKTTEYITKNPEQFILNTDCDLNKYLAVSGFFGLVAQAKENGDFPLPRDRVLFFQGLRRSEVLVNMTRVPRLSGIRSEDLTAAEAQAHKQVDITVSFLQKYIPGFGNAQLQTIAAATGVRESRRIAGVQTLTKEMVLNGARHKDSVAVCAFPIDIHDPSGADLGWVRKEKECCYDIPYGVMLPQNISNLLVTGRCISAQHEAIASARVTPTAMALGQAAGAAAFLAAAQDRSCAEISVEELQKLLAEDGAVPGKNWL